MSWSDYYPVLTDETVSDYGSLPPDKCQQEVALLSVDKALNRGGVQCSRIRNIPPLNPPDENRKPHVIAMSLFAGQEVLSVYEKLTVEELKKISSEGKNGDSKFSVWERWIDPLIREIPRLRQYYPEVVLKIYLSKEFHFLADLLAEIGCEVNVMASGSKYESVCLMWRYLALNGEEELFTVISLSQVDVLDRLIQQTRQMDEMGLGLWRSPVSPHSKNEMYLPIGTKAFGGRLPDDDIELLLLTFLRLNFSQVAGHELFLNTQKQKNTFEGLDNTTDEQLFLTSCLYPRLAELGSLTVVEPWCQSVFLALDVEYVTWANPDSELVVVGEL